MMMMFGTDGCRQAAIESVFTMAAAVNFPLAAECGIWVKYLDELCIVMQLVLHTVKALAHVITHIGATAPCLYFLVMERHKHTDRFDFPK